MFGNRNIFKLQVCEFVCPTLQGVSECPFSPKYCSSQHFHHTLEMWVFGTNASKMHLCANAQPTKCQTIIKSLSRALADGWRHVPTRLQMGLQAQSAALIQLALLRCSAPECCVPCHTYQWWVWAQNCNGTAQMCIWTSLSIVRHWHDIYSFIRATQIVQKSTQLALSFPHKPSQTPFSSSHSIVLLFMGCTLRLTFLVWVIWFDCNSWRGL